jgi:hypothetical protein
MRASTRAWADAVRSVGIDPGPRVRPGVLRWFWYALWGPLPAQHRWWVLYDTTCTTWVLRHIARVVAIVAVPVTAIALWLPTTAGIRGLTAAVTGLCAVLLVVMWVNEGTEHRLLQAGFPWGLGPQIRERRSDMAQRMR